MVYAAGSYGRCEVSYSLRLRHSGSLSGANHRPELSSLCRRNNREIAGGVCYSNVWRSEERRCLTQHASGPGYQPLHSLGKNTVDVYFQFPRLNELLQVEAMLEKKQILFDAKNIESQETCRLINHHFPIKHETVCLLDRNIVSDLVRLYQGGRVVDSHFRAVAALQAFLNAAEIQSEPSIAYHEYIDGVDLKQADTELSIFRAADNLDPNIYLDIALGVRDHVPTNLYNPHASGVLLSANIPEKLKHFERNIVTLKKALVIRKQSSSDYEALLKLTDWLYKEYMFTTPALFFAYLYYSGGRVGGMLKSNSEKHIRNATWDLCFLQAWASPPKSDKPIRWLAATNDKAIKQIAKLMFLRYDETDDEYFQRLQGEFSRMWGEKHKRGKELLEKLKLYTNDLDNSDRAIRKFDSEYVLNLRRCVAEEFNEIIQ